MLRDRQKVVDKILFVRRIKIRFAVRHAAARFARNRHRIVGTVGKQNHGIDTTVGQRRLQRLLRIGVAGKIIDPRVLRFVKDIKALGVVPIVGHAVVVRVDPSADVVAIDIEAETVVGIELLHQIFTHVVICDPMAPPTCRGAKARDRLLTDRGRKRERDIRSGFSQPADPRAHSRGKAEQKHGDLDENSFYLLHSGTSLRVSYTIFGRPLSNK